MKTIAMCALLAALAFGLLPGNRDEAAAPDEGLVLLVETQQDAQAIRKHLLHGRTSRRKPLCKQRRMHRRFACSMAAR